MATKAECRINLSLQSDRDEWAGNSVLVGEDCERQSHTQVSLELQWVLSLRVDFVLGDRPPDVLADHPDIGDLGPCLATSKSLGFQSLIDRTQPSEPKPSPRAVAVTPVSPL